MLGNLTNSISKIIILIILIVILLILVYLLFKSVLNKKNKQSGAFLTHNTLAKWICQDIEIKYINNSSYDNSIYFALSNNKKFIELMNEYRNCVENQKNEIYRQEIINRIKKLFDVCDAILENYTDSINSKLSQYIHNTTNSETYNAINNANYGAFIALTYEETCKLPDLDTLDDNEAYKQLMNIYNWHDKNVLMIDSRYDYVISSRYNIFNYITFIYSEESKLIINDVYNDLYDNIINTYSLKCDNKNKIRIHEDLFMFHLTQGLIVDSGKSREVDNSMNPYNKGSDHFNITGLVSFKLLQTQINNILKIQKYSDNNDNTFITSDIHGKFIDYVCFLLKAGRLKYNGKKDDYYYFTINFNSPRIVFLGDIPNTKVLYAEHDEKLYIQQNLLYQLFTITYSTNKKDIYIRGNHCRNIPTKQVELIDEIDIRNNIPDLIKNTNEIDCTDKMKLIDFAITIYSVLDNPVLYMDTVMKYCKHNKYNKELKNVALKIYKKFIENCYLNETIVKNIDFITYFSLNNILQNHASFIYASDTDCYVEYIDDYHRLAYTHENICDLCLTAYRILNTNLKRLPVYKHNFDCNDFIAFINNCSYYDYVYCAIEILRLPLLADEIYNIITDELHMLNLEARILIDKNINKKDIAKHIVNVGLPEILNRSTCKTISISGHVGTNFNKGSFGTRISTTDIMINCIDEHPELFEDIYTPGLSQAMMYSDATTNGISDSSFTNYLNNSFKFSCNFIPISIDVSYAFSPNNNFGFLDVRKVIGVFAMVKLNIKKLTNILTNNELIKATDYGFNSECNLFKAQNLKEIEELPIEYHVYYRYVDKIK